KPAHLEFVRHCLTEQDGHFIEPCSGRTPEVIHLSKVCVAISGSVGLELLHRLKPSVIVYRLRSGWFLRVVRFFMKCPYISLVNLLAGRELFPEYLTARCEADAVSGHVLRWLDDRIAYETACRALAGLRGQVAETGACQR